MRKKQTTRPPAPTAAGETGGSVSSTGSHARITSTASMPEERACAEENRAIATSYTDDATRQEPCAGRAATGAIRLPSEPRFSAKVCGETPDVEAAATGRPGPGALVRRALRADARAWDGLLILLRPPALAVARRIVRHDADAEDIAQDTMRIVFENLVRLDDPDRVVGWTCIIARNRAINRVTRRREHAGSESSLVAHEQATAATPFDRRADVHRALDRLPSEQLEVVTLHHVEGLSWEEIAAVQGVSIATARSRLRLAEEKLAKILGGDGE